MQGRESRKWKRREGNGKSCPLQSFLNVGAYLPPYLVMNMTVDVVQGTLLDCSPANQQSV